MPERFEHGTLPYELLAGVTAAVDWLAALDPEATGDRSARLAVSLASAEEHERRLLAELSAGLAALPGLTNWSRAAQRTPTTLLTFDRLPAAEVANALADQAIQAPAGSFYAWETSHRLGLGASGGLRIGLAPYNDSADVRRLLSGLAVAIDTRR